MLSKLKNKCIFKKILSNLVLFSAILSSPVMAAFLSPDTSYVMNIKVGSSCWAAGDCSSGNIGLFTDNNDVISTTSGASYGSSVGGDGWAGVISFTTDASGESFSVDSFNQDGRPNGPPDRLVFFSDTPELMTGTVDANGDMVFIPASRMALSGFFIDFIGVQPWNFDDSSQIANPSNTWEPLTTGTSTNQGSNGNPDSIFSLTGSPLISDGQGGWDARLVAAGNMGDDWLAFSSTPYTEIWDVNITQVSAVPVPAAVWLFGSGLIALIGFTRRGKIN